MSAEALECIYSLGGLTARYGWDRIWTWVSGRSIDLDSLTLYGERIEPHTFGAYIDSKRLQHFLVEGSGCTIRYSPVGGYDHCLVTIRCDDGVTFEEWVALVSTLSNQQLVTARVYNVEYEFWQNACDPLQYTARGRAYDHLSLRSNGLPFPLERTIIDTSRNPGRRVLRNGYVEAIGALMVVGRLLPGRTGKQVGAFLRASNAVGISADSWLIQFATKCFDSDYGESREIQDLIRNELFSVPASE